jgi:16S rRNA (guanine(966)-N(2))-methyltransferase RsmD
MRIYGNREIKTLSGRDTRPTTSKVREAVFNIWQERIINCTWLDLCAGNGSMGAESLCRGASEVVAIEKNPRACQIIRENWQKVANAQQKFLILKGDVLHRLKTIKKKQFDLIYADPPYESNLYQPILKLITEHNLLKNSGQMAIEYDPKKPPLIDIVGLELLQTKTYGRTAVSFYNLTLKSDN